MEDPPGTDSGLFKKFLNTCKLTVKEPEVDKAVEKISKQYEKVNPSYRDSEVFKKFLRKVITEIETSPWNSMRRVLADLKYHTYPSTPDIQHNGVNLLEVLLNDKQGNSAEIVEAMEEIGELFNALQSSSDLNVPIKDLLEENIEEVKVNPHQSTKAVSDYSKSKCTVDADGESSDEEVGGDGESSSSSSSIDTESIRSTECDYGSTVSSDENRGLKGSSNSVAIGIDSVPPPSIFDTTKIEVIKSIWNQSVGSSEERNIFEVFAVGEMQPSRVNIDNIEDYWINKSEYDEAERIYLEQRAKIEKYEKIKARKRDLTKLNLEISELGNRRISDLSADVLSFSKIRKSMGNYLETYQRILKLNNASPSPLNNEKAIIFTGTEYPIINLEIERFYNEHGGTYLPLLEDICDVVKQTNVRENLNLTDSKCKEISKTALQILAEIRRAQREDDFKMLISSHLPMDDSNDPASSDRSLRTKLDNNAALNQERMDSVINKYADRENVRMHRRSQTRRRSLVLESLDDLDIGDFLRCTLFPS